MIGSFCALPDTRLAALGSVCFERGREASSRAARRVRTALETNDVDEFPDRAAGVFNGAAHAGRRGMGDAGESGQSMMVRAAVQAPTTANRKPSGPSLIRSAVRWGSDDRSFPSATELRARDEGTT